MRRLFQVMACAIVLFAAISQGANAQEVTCADALRQSMITDGVEPSKYAFIQCLIELQNRIEHIGAQQGLASGTVIARNQTCPPGWTEYVDGRGRVIVGAGDGGPDLTNRPVNDMGGSESPEMPSHRHSFHYRITNNVDLRAGTGADEAITALSTAKDLNKAPSLLETQNTAHEVPNMPPYIALYFCEKN